MCGFILILKCKYLTRRVNFRVLVGVTVKITVLCFFTPCRLLCLYQSYFYPEIEEIDSCETLMSTRLNGVTLL